MPTQPVGHSQRVATCGQRIWLVLADSGVTRLATSCRRLRPLRSINAPSRQTRSAAIGAHAPALGADRGSVTCPDERVLWRSPAPLAERPRVPARPRDRARPAARRPCHVRTLTQALSRAWAVPVAADDTGTGRTIFTDAAVTVALGARCAGLRRHWGRHLPSWSRRRQTRLRARAERRSTERRRRKGLLDHDHRHHCR